MTIEKRIQKAEERLGMDGGESVVVHQIVKFGGTLPPEERRGNQIIRYVAYENLQDRLEGEAANEH